MPPEQVDMAQTSVESALPIREQAAEMFYGHLFQLDPSIRRLFHGDMAEQGRKLMTAIGGGAALKNPGSVVGTIEELGVRHLDYGVTDNHYGTVGEACSGPWKMGSETHSRAKSKRRGARRTRWSRAS